MAWPVQFFSHTVLLLVVGAHEKAVYLEKMSLAKCKISLLAHYLAYNTSYWYCQELIVRECVRLVVSCRAAKLYVNTSIPLAMCALDDTDDSYH